MSSCPGTPPVPDATGLELIAQELASAVLDTVYFRERATLVVEPVSIMVDTFNTCTIPEAAIRHASQATVPAWDSVATITLLNVIDDEFQVLLDYERLAEFNSFRTINEFLEQSPM